MAVHTILEMHLMDVLTAYLFGSLGTHIYIKIPPDLETTNQVVSIPNKYRGIKL